MALRIATVTRVDALQQGDTTLEGAPIALEITEHEEASSYQTMSVEGEITDVAPGSAPQSVVITVGKQKKTLSPSDMIVVLR